MATFASAIAILFILSCSSYCLLTSAESQAPALFIFGDSIVDCGNNDYLLNSTATADYLPYGMDFFAVTGRFSNARNLADCVAESLGFEHLIACSRDPNSTGERILNGVNYASAGTGILDNSTAEEIVTPLRYQVIFFQTTTLPELESLLGSNVSSFLAKSLFLFNTGGNDMVDQCFQTGESCDIAEFSALLISKLTQIFEWLYSLGARKFIIFSTESSGCTPVARDMTSDGGCSEEFDSASVTYNQLVNASIDKFAEALPGSHFVFVSIYTVINELINDPTTYGYTNVKNACCEMVSEGSSCVKNGPACTDRTKYLFWDGGHPTDKTNSILANKIYDTNNTSISYPFSIKELAAINSTGEAAGSSLLIRPWSKAPNGKGAQ